MSGTARCRHRGSRPPPPLNQGAWDGTCLLGFPPALVTVSKTTAACKWVLLAGGLQRGGPGVAGGRWLGWMIRGGNTLSEEATETRATGRAECE